jgi:hypothetical protein
LLHAARQFSWEPASEPFEPNPVQEFIDPNAISFFAPDLEREVYVRVDVAPRKQVRLLENKANLAVGSTHRAPVEEDISRRQPMQA